VRQTLASALVGSAKTQSLNQARLRASAASTTLYRFQLPPFTARLPQRWKCTAKYRMFFAFTGGSLVLVTRHLVRRGRSWAFRQVMPTTIEPLIKGLHRGSHGDGLQNTVHHPPTRRRAPYSLYEHREILVPPQGCALSQHDISLTTACLRSYLVGVVVQLALVRQHERRGYRGQAAPGATAWQAGHNFLLVFVVASLLLCDQHRCAHAPHFVVWGGRLIATWHRAGL
jgi:hypothetical protein